MASEHAKTRVVTPEMYDLLIATASKDERKAVEAQYELATALTTPLREAVLSGDIVTDIFEVVPVGPNNSTLEYPMDILAPGNEGDFVAYTIPSQGGMPTRALEGDYLMIPTYDIGHAVEWNLKLARDANWDVVARALNILRAGFVKKMNDDGWHTLMAAAADRNIIVYDADASAGQFTKRLVSLLKLVMRRNGGGNSASNSRGRLTDLYLSPEAMEDMRSWGVDQVDEVTRREIFVAGDGQFNRVFGVNFHDTDEFGVDQEYELYLENDLSVSPVSTGSDVELLVGLDMVNRDSFIMAEKGGIEVFPDPTLHKHRKEGYYAWNQVGFGIVDSRRCILASL